MTDRILLAAPPLVLDVGDERAWLNGKPLELGPKPFALLHALMQSPERLLTKEELFDSVWQGRIVSEAVLTTAMRDLRRALGDDAREPRFIATVHGRGYRFVRPVTEESQPTPTPAPPAEPQRAALVSATPLAQPLLLTLLALAAIVALTAFSSVDWQARRANAAAFAGIDPASIAVLPFEDLSPGGGQSHVSDGLAEEVLNMLMGVDGLTVASRTSAFAYANRDTPLPEIAQQLRVRHALEGSVRVADGQLRVRVRLLDARSDRTLWARTYDRALSVENMLAIQDEIAQRVVNELQLPLEGVLGPRDLATRSAAAGTHNLDAYEAFLRSRELFLARADLPRSVRFAEEAVRADPDFARGWEMLAAARFVQTGSATPQAIQAVDNALRLDANLSLAHALNGVLRNFETPYDWHRTISELERALELDPRNTTAMLWLGAEMHKLGYLERAQSLLERCLELDPAYDRCRRHLYWTLYMRGDADGALAQFDRLVADGARPEEIIVLSPLIARGQEEQARAMIASLDAETPMPEAIYAALADPFANRIAARRALRQWVEGVHYRRNIYPVIFELGAYDLLPRGQGSNFGLWLPEAAAYRRSAAFKRFITSMGIDQYWRAHGYPPQCRAVGAGDFDCASG